jgi:cytochrome b subunit of formate dehydrogenase
MRRACTACHAGAVQRALVDVHADSIACTDCHGVHDMRPVPDDATRRIDIALARSCSGCHAREAATYWRDVHGRTTVERAEGRRPIEGDTAATCVSCHGEHGIRSTSDPSWRFAVADACIGCHRDYGRTFRDSYHGQASRVGSRKAAQCADCHTAHAVYPASDTASSVAAVNRLATCRRCHAEARRNFAGYRPHANPRSRAEGGVLFHVWLFMNVALYGTIVVWGTHAGLWFWRSTRERRGHRVPAAVGVPMDSALRGGGPLVWRFPLLFRLIHAMIILSFYALVITGLPLRYSCTAWAPALMRLLGGPETAGVVHRTAGVLMFGYFGVYLVHVVNRFVRSRDRLRMFTGPDTIVFRLQDLRDLVSMVRYFFGRGPHPRFGRYSYLEKFDYFAELWGVLVIGFTGLMLWFPEAFARVFPGIAFNIAIIVHSYEAMIATAFIFTIHFFNVHLRPEKWPLDGVMFTGRATLQYLREEHPLVAEAIEERVTRAAPSRRAITDEPAPPPPAWMNAMAAITGLLLLGLGILLIGLVLWGSMC